MQEATGFISFDQESNTWKCIRSDFLYDSITCPEGYAKKTPQQVEQGCADLGLPCEEEEGFQCICHPCYKLTDCIDSIPMLGRCVAYNVFLPSLLVPIALLGIVLCMYLLQRKSYQMVQQAKQAAQNERDLVRIDFFINFSPCVLR